MAEITYVVITSITIVTKLRIILFVITFNTLMVDIFRSLITFYVCLMFTNLTIWLRAVLAITSSLARIWARQIWSSGVSLKIVKSYDQIKFLADFPIVITM